MKLGRMYFLCECVGIFVLGYVKDSCNLLNIKIFDLDNKIDFNFLWRINKPRFQTQPSSCAGTDTSAAFWNNQLCSPLPCTEHNWGLRGPSCAELSEKASPTLPWTGKGTCWLDPTCSDALNAYPNITLQVDPRQKCGAQVRPRQLATAQRYSWQRNSNYLYTRRKSWLYNFSSQFWRC